MSRDLAAEVEFLTRALKAPTLREAVPRLAEWACEQSWSHEEFLIACLQREAAARESHGGEGRIRAARSRPAGAWRTSTWTTPAGSARADRPPGHAGLITARENVLLLGPPGTGKTHLATGLAIRACQAGYRIHTGRCRCPAL